VIALVTSAKAGATNGATTSSVDTTGADFLAIALANYIPGDASGTAFSDSKSNTYSTLTTHNSSEARSRLAYKYNATVGSGHTFTYDPTANNYSGIVAAAFSGVLTSGDPFDQQNGATTEGATSLAPGSVTPSENNELVLAAWAFRSDPGSTPSLGGGFTLIDYQVFDGAWFACALGYLIQTTAAAANPTASWTNSVQAASSIATFKAAAGGGGGGTAVPVFLNHLMNQG
jgi:hypothetical protein